MLKTELIFDDFLGLSNGVYLQLDPIRYASGDINLYRYCKNNPLNYVDPLGLYWEYQQTTGDITYVDNATGVRTYINTGYSGHGKEGINNPNMENVPNIGPIPCGIYDIGKMRNSKQTGHGIMDLSPRPGTNTYGRIDFQIHGDKIGLEGKKTASHGCIISDRDTRNAIADSEDNELRVVR